ncbi:MAG: hypothetical protein JNL28_09345 [Planctomycetes bacterium]|nr:hypothetical protein [Planctomycetota bacterium]
MSKLIDLVEGLLHGEYRGRDFLRQDSPLISSRTFVLLILIQGAVYGACMSLYGLKWGVEYGGQHVTAVMVKVPCLFLLTLLVTAPSLYVFSSLAGSKLKLGQTVRLLLASTALSLAVLMSFAPVTAFFTFSTKSHPFMQLLNAVVFTVSGVIGMHFVKKRLAEALQPEDTDGDSPRPARPPALTFLLFVWFVIYGSVAGQMGWILRPFVGTPHMPQELFRETEKNIFYGLGQALKFLD